MSERVIYLVTDYKGNFGSKYNDIPYRSGFDRNTLKELFLKHCLIAEFINPSDQKVKSLDFSGAPVLYTSQEDDTLLYKSFLEDFIYYVMIRGGVIIPSFHLFKAHENKLFFEMIRNSSPNRKINNIKSSWYGTYEDFCKDLDNINFPVVLKSYKGSMSRGVFLLEDKNQGLRIAKKSSKSSDLLLNLKDIIRALKHKGYTKESWHRQKFILQEFLPGLSHDFKILIYAEKFYVLKREIKKNDFRASGQGMFSFTKDITDGLLDFSNECFKLFDCPQASFDIAFNGDTYFLLEAQFLYFGTYTIECSPFFFRLKENNWICVEERSNIEEEYVNSLVNYINDKRIIRL